MEYGSYGGTTNWSIGVVGGKGKDWPRTYVRSYMGTTEERRNHPRTDVRSYGGFDRGKICARIGSVEQGGRKRSCMKNRIQPRKLSGQAGAWNQGGKGADYVIGGWKWEKVGRKMAKGA